ncbi:MAG: hypothetical protein ACKV19_00605 [Verrucomicrobiales bacterium]
MRDRFDALHRKVTGTPLEQEVGLLARDARKLFDHVELLHRETRRWWSEARPSAPEGEDTSKDVNDPEMQRAALSIRREQHEQSSDSMEFIKALLMWVETPEEHAGVGADTRTQP